MANIDIGTQTSLIAAKAQLETSNGKDFLNDKAYGIGIFGDYKFSEKFEQTIAAVYLSVQVLSTLLGLICILFVICHGLKCCIAHAKIQKLIGRCAFTYLFPAYLPYAKLHHHRNNNNSNENSNNNSNNNNNDAFTQPLKKAMERAYKSHWLHKTAPGVHFKRPPSAYQRVYRYKTDMNANNLHKLRQKEQRHNNSPERSHNKISLQKHQIIMYIDSICLEIKNLNHKIGKWSNFLHSFQYSAPLNSVLKSKMGIEIIKELDLRTFQVTALQLKALLKIETTLKNLKSAVEDIDESQWEMPEKRSSEQLQADVNYFLNDYIARELCFKKAQNYTHYLSDKVDQHFTK